MRRSKVTGISARVVAATTLCLAVALAFSVPDAFADGKPRQKKGPIVKRPLTDAQGHSLAPRSAAALKHESSASMRKIVARGGVGTSCCETGHGPGCDDPVVESCVCASDSFCCDTDWDSFCVGEVDSFACGTCFAPVTNDDCGDATVIPGDGSYAFDTGGATNDGSALPVGCDEGFGTGMGADVWFSFTAVCDSDVSISLCSANYDARLAVYNGATCVPSSAALEACDDDGCGTLGGPSDLTFSATAGTTYLIRVGGFDDGGGAATGSGNMVVTGAGSGVATDCNNNSIADGCELSDVTDCDGNDVLDECELGSLPDCNNNSTPDACETGNDCNGNGVPDDCDIAGGTSNDLDNGGTPDECEDDCNGNGIPDGVDVVGGTSNDCQDDGIPDECQLGRYAIGAVHRGGNPVQDPSFEAGPFGGIWDESSTNFGTPICDEAGCGLGTGTGPHTGAFWTWFGGIGTFEEGSVAQDVTIPSGGATLSFFLEQIVCDSAADFVEVLIDGNQVFLSDGGAAICGQLGYTEQIVDISAFADGGTHNLEFHSEIFAQNGSGTNFFVDDITITEGGSGGPGADCNENGIPDECDITSGSSSDCDSNGRPDECEFNDCDNNGIKDECELLADPSLDLGGEDDGSACDVPDGVLDRCQDCNNNNVVDCADLLPGTDNIKDQSVSGLGIAIADCDTVTDQPVSHSIVFSECGTIDDLDVALQVTHTWVGDLIVTLEHEDTGTATTLMWRVGADNPGTCGTGGSVSPFGNGNDNLDVIFDDEAAEPIETQTGPLNTGGRFRPSAEGDEGSLPTLLSTFDGEDKCGTWTITISDNGGGDTGTFTGWGMTFTNGGEIPPFSQDCNSNDTPDECDIAAGTSDDCNVNGTPDECEPDCNANGSPDDCDVTFGGAADCDGNLVPDECEPDCNLNNVADACDILSGNSDDCNKDGKPDECSGSPGGLKVIDVDAGIAIPDGTGEFVCSTFEVTEGGAIQDVDVDVQATHTFIGDLIITVEHNDTLVTLWNEQCGTQENMDVIFDDEGDDMVTCDQIPAGLNVPTADGFAGGDGLSVYDGMDKAGEWTVCVSDNAGFDTGTFDSWSLHLTNLGTQSVELIDCNENGLLDECDILFAISTDCDDNDIPDECTPCDSATLISDDFCEGLPAGWTATGSAHVTDACAQPDPCDQCEGISQWVYFGRDSVCQKAEAADGPVDGVLSSPPLDISSYTSVSLEYCSIYNGERGLAPNGIDAAWVEVNGTIVDDVGYQNQNVDVWETRSIDLTPFISDGIVTVSWHFDTADSINNQFLGWQIDSVTIDAEDSDCNDNNVIDQCDVASGFSDDFNKNFCPDECEDCNGNGILDDFDVQPGQVKYYQNNFPGGLAIPDNSAAGVVTAINVGEFGPVVDLDLAVVIDHPNIGDLEIELTHIGVSAVLVSRPSGGANTNDGMDLILDDEAQVSIAVADAGGDNVLTGHFRPSPDALSAFDGMPKSNPWVLTVRDLSGGNVGTILSYQLRMANAPPTSEDCNFNGVPDECESDDDCNNNGTLDECELADNDCNANGIPDDCELAGNDCNANNTPDDCETDCDENGTPDDCDIAGGADDCNNNDIPDVCELSSAGGGTYSSTPGIAIPDNDPAGVTDIISVPDSFSIEDLNVSLDVTHTFFGDFCVTLTHPSGSPTVQLIARPGADNGSDVCHTGSPFGCNSNDPSIVLDDEGADGPVEDACGADTSSVVTPGSYTPFDALSAFDGLDSAGDWTITVADNGSGDTGTFNGWSLEFGATASNDCNNNGTLDSCDIASGASDDDNFNNIPDECEEPEVTNDVCADATPLSVPDSVSDDTSTGTADVAPFCGTSDGTAGGLWYSVIGTGQQITASLCGSSFDTKIRVYTDGCGTLTCVAGNDDACSTQSEITWCSEIGVEYLILVHGFNANEGTFTLDISDAGACPAPLANDLCEDATAFTDGDLPFTDTDVQYGDATNDIDVACNSGSASESRFGVWYTYTPSVDCTLSTSISASPFQDTATAYFSGTDCNSLSEEACADPESSSHDLTGGTTYWVMISRWSAFSDPSAPLDVTFDCTPLFRGVPDMDLDGDIDLVDFARFQICAGQGLATGECIPADVNMNGVVDDADAAEFTRFLHGPVRGKSIKELP
ncbi:MAG: proprotein convertase P-domain-containing protein [Phycisphaerales bacterium]|nr:proprotein convertase P-domain-containing protein [Phycisphaerales bacterium]